MNSIPLYMKLIIATAEIIAAWMIVSFLRFLLIEIYEKYAKKGRYILIESKVVPKIVIQNTVDSRIQLVHYFIAFGLWGLDEFFFKLSIKNGTLRKSILHLRPWGLYR
jgi:hypothetical protein